MYRGVPSSMPGSVKTVVSSSLGIDRARQAEIEQLDAVRREEHVRRLQIAMHDPPPVQHVERREHRDRRRDRLGRRERPRFQAVRQRLALEKLHREKRLAVVLADLEELADVRVAHGRGGPRLAQQTIPHLRIRRREERLDRDRTLQSLVDRFVHDPHAASSDLADDAIVPDAVRHVGDR